MSCDATLSQSGRESSLTSIVAAATSEHASGPSRRDIPAFLLLPTTGKIAVKVINRYWDEVLKVYEVGQ